MDCVSCSQPCADHPWVPAAMAKRLNSTKPMGVKEGQCARKVAFVCYGTTGYEWTPKPSKDDARFMAARAQLEADANVYICSEPSRDAEGAVLDVLEWPAGTRRALAEGAVAAPLPEGHVWLLVCTHAKRDNRCGVGGTMVVDALRAAAHDQPHVHVLEMSHVGGHGFAGNVLVMPAGVLLGRVTPCHAGVVLEGLAKGVWPEAITRGNVIKPNDSESW